MKPRVSLTIAAVAATLAGSLTIFSCGNDPPPPASKIKAPPGLTGPTTAEVMTRTPDESPTGPNPLHYEAIPPLGPATAWKGPDGTLWAKHANGIMIANVRPGKGHAPQPGQTVAVKYVGYLPRVDGEKEFDRSGEKPLEFSLGKKAGFPNNVIKGWHQVVATMKPGGKLRAHIPPDLAYGKEGRLPTIPPGAPLIFDMELVEVRGQAAKLPEGATSQIGIPELEILKLNPQLGPQTPATTEPATAPASGPAEPAK
jgi:peptidylprolyl isomerase